MKLHYLSKREKNILFDLIDKNLPLLNIEKIKDIKSIHINADTAIIISDSFILIRSNDTVFPFLKDKETLGKLPIITVDQGAIRFICNGANIMRPGIKHIEHDFQKNTIVVIVEELHATNIAVGRTLYSKTEILNLKQGPVISNLHFLGDDIWKSSLSIDILS
ncbi:MAG: hypothetical protein CMO11_04670 [Thaumarchaeota archaeon]|nr:hypothetical protein [Nitrososphaerota archaeon]